VLRFSYIPIFERGLQCTVLEVLENDRPSDIKIYLQNAKVSYLIFTHKDKVYPIRLKRSKPLHNDVFAATLMERLKMSSEKFKVLTDDQKANA